MKIKNQFSNLKTGAKRVFVGLLVLCLFCTATGIGSIFATATEDPTDPLPCTHENTKRGIAEGACYTVVCADCGEVLQTVDHSYSWADNGDNTESYKCIECGDVQETRGKEITTDPGSQPGDGDGDGETAHVHNTDIDNGRYLYNGDDTHYRYECSECGYKHTEPCVYDSYTPKDETTHYKRCSTCGNSIEEACVFEEYTSNGDGTKTGTCVCGNTDTIPEEEETPAPKVMLRTLATPVRNAAAANEGFSETSDAGAPLTYSDFFEILPTINSGLVYNGSSQRIVNNGTQKSSEAMKDYGVTSWTIDAFDSPTSGNPMQTNAGSYTVEYKITYKYKSAAGAEATYDTYGTFVTSIAKAPMDSVTIMPESGSYVETTETTAPYCRLKLGSNLLVQGTDYNFSPSDGFDSPAEIGTSKEYTFEAVEAESSNYTGSVTKTITVEDVELTYNGGALKDTFRRSVTVAPESGYQIKLSGGSYASTWECNFDSQAQSHSYTFVLKKSGSNKEIQKTVSFEILSEDSEDFVIDELVSLYPQFVETADYTGGDISLMSVAPTFNTSFISENGISYTWGFEYEDGTVAATGGSPTAKLAGDYKYKFYVEYTKGATTKRLYRTDLYESKILKDIGNSEITYTAPTGMADYQSIASTIASVKDYYTLKDSGTNTDLVKDTHYQVSVEPEANYYEATTNITLTYTGIEGAYYKGTATKTIPVSDITVLLNGQSKQVKYNDSVTFTAEGYNISDSPDGVFKESFTYSEPCSEYTLPLYFQKKTTGRIVLKKITDLNIGDAASVIVLYDGEDYVKPLYMDSVRITAKGFKVAYVKNGQTPASSDYKDEYVCEYAADRNMVPVDTFTLSFKDEKTGMAYKKEISGINLAKTPTGFDISYNGSTTKKDWYSGDVTIEAVDYKIAPEERYDSISSYAAKYIMTGTGVVSKELYFLPKASQTTTGAIKAEVVVAIDATNPSGVISINGVSSNSFTKTDEVKTYVTTDAKANISCSDALSGVDKAEYYVADKFYASTSELNAAMTEDKKVWREYSADSKPALTSGKKNYIYARITDKAGNETYVSLGAVVFDNTPPTVSALTVAQKEDSSDFIVDIIGKDDLSGVRSFRLKYEKKTADSKLPTKQDMYDNGILVTINNNEENYSGGTYTTNSLEGGVDYIFYALAVDKAGNLSEVSEQSLSGKDIPGGAKGSGSGAGSGGSGSSSLTPAPNGIAGKGSGSNKSKSGSKKSSTTPTKETTADKIKNTSINRNPYIVDATGSTQIGEINTSGWNRIKEEVTKADEGAEISVEMSGFSDVPEEMLETIAERDDVVVKFKMAEDVEWAIQGSDIDVGAAKNMDLGVKLGSKNIPAQVLSDITGSYPHVEFSINHDGELGFTAVLSVPVGVKNKGKHATLYFYDTEKKELLAQATSVVDDQGYAKFPLSHCSDYTVVITPERVLSADEVGYAVGTAVQSTGSSTGSGSGAQIRLIDLFGISPVGRIWLFIISLICAGLCVAILYMPRFQRQEAGNQSIFDFDKFE